VRTASGDLFFSTTAIVCQEILKVLVSIVLLYLESNSFTELCNQINQQIIKNPFDSIKTGIPAFLFTIQTNLVYLAISNLDAAVFQVTFQIKILTTALFTVILLNRSLRCSQWLSLVLLCIGISIIQIQNVSSQSSSGEDHKNALYGLFCVILACVLSGLAGVYFEKILKNSKVSIWVRNIQLGLFGTFFALLTAFSYLFNTVIDFIFAFGTLLVVLSVMLYSYVPPNNSASVSESTSQASSLSSSPKQLLVNEKNENFSKLINDSTIDLIQYKLNNNNVSIEMNSK